MKVEVGGTSYYMNKYLKAMWDNIRGGKLKKLDEDRVYIVDGRERSGKSLFSIQQAAYIDPSILNDLSRITFTTEDTLKAIRNTKSTNTETKVIIFDEAFRGLSSKSAISKVNKQIVQALMEMGQSNIVLFLNSPSFFLLETYPAVLRSNALFHIEKVKGNRKRFFKGYNEEKKGDLYRIGIRKGWRYNIKTNFRDWFFEKYPGGDDFERRYRDKKYKSLRDMGENLIEKPIGEITKEVRLEIVRKAIETGNQDRKKVIADLCNTSLRTIQSDFSLINKENHASDGRNI